MLIKRSYILLAMFLMLIFSCEKGEDIPENKEEEIPEIIDGPYDKSIAAISIQNNIVWVGTFKNGLYKIEGESLTHYTQSDGLISDTIKALAVSNNGTLWIGTNMGISKFINETWTSFSSTEGLHSNDIRSLACDLTNNVWIGTRNNRVIKYDGTNFTSIHINPAVSGEGELGHIHTVASDLNGNIWVGSCISGLSRFDGTIWSNSINDLSSFVQSSICTTDNNVWFGHSSGAYKFSDNEWTQFSVTDGLVGNAVSCFTIDQQNNIWIGTNVGLSKYDGSVWTTYNTENGLQDNYVKALACDSNGDIWVGTSAGLAKLN